MRGDAAVAIVRSRRRWRRAAASRCRDASIDVVQRETLSHEPNPGERDRATLTAREPGFGTFPAATSAVATPALLSEDDIEELRRDGGGLSRKHKR